MRSEVTFADLQLTVVISASADTPFAHLTANEVMTMQQIVYMSLNTFLITRAGFSMQNVLTKKYRDCETHKCQCTCHGG